MNGYLAVIGKLRADGPLGLLIGGSGVSSARIFPGEAPQGLDYPQVSVDTYDDDPHDTQSGVSYTDTEMVKVFGRARTDAEAYLISDAIRDCLDGASGVVNGVTFEWCRYRRIDTYDEQVSNVGSTTKHQRIRVHEQDYEVRVIR